MEPLILSVQSESTRRRMVRPACGGQTFEIISPGTWTEATISLRADGRISGYSGTLRCQGCKSAVQLRWAA